MIDFGLSILSGLVSGMISGIIVYLITKNREKKEKIYLYWFNFLFGVMDRCKVYIPSEAIENISTIGKRGSRWYDAIFEILDEINPYEVEDREFDEHEDRIAKNVLIALTELNLWKKKNHIR